MFKLHALTPIFLSGEFGIVYKAHLLPKLQLDKSSPCPLPETVAVKTLKGMHHNCMSICAFIVDSVKNTNC